jgi:hypothetical protein
MKNVCSGANARNVTIGTSNQANVIEAMIKLTWLSSPPVQMWHDECGAHATEFTLDE